MRKTTSPLGLAALALGLGAGCADQERAAADDLAGLSMPEQARSDLEVARARMMRETAMKAEPSMNEKVLARAEPDACYEAIGVEKGAPPCKAGARAKIDQTDLASGAVAEDYAYFGTASNPGCVFVGLYVPGIAPFATDNWACELGAGPGEFKKIGAGDLRAPKILRLDETSGKMEDITPKDDRLLESTIGLFATSAAKGVVLLSGPSLGAEGIDGVNVFALDAKTGRILKSGKIGEYAGFTQGVMVKNELYFGASTVDLRDGVVLKWTGDAFDPLRFEVVGDLDLPPSAIVEHGGRLAVAEHAAMTREGAASAMPGLVLSPTIGEKGLEERDQGEWTRIFEMDEYEPDPIVARSTSFAGLASFGGRLFFTTAQHPIGVTLAEFDAYGRPSKWYERLGVHVHTARAASLLVMDDVGAARQNVTLLYGYDEVPVIDPAKGEIMARRNNLDQEPRFGPAGIGSPLNHIAMLTATKDRLYVSTFDSSTVAPDLLRSLIAQKPLLDLPMDVVDVLEPITQDIEAMFGGADLYRMDAPYAPLVAEDLNGLGNRSNMGIDVILPSEGKLYVGTSNPFNLRTGEKDPGGYELVELTPKAEMPGAKMPGKEEGKKPGAKAPGKEEGKKPRAKTPERERPHGREAGGKRHSERY